MLCTALCDYLVSQRSAFPGWAHSSKVLPAALLIKAFSTDFLTWKSSTRLYNLCDPRRLQILLYLDHTFTFQILCGFLSRSQNLISSIPSWVTLSWATREVGFLLLQKCGRVKHTRKTAPGPGHRSPAVVCPCGLKASLNPPSLSSLTPALSTVWSESVEGLKHSPKASGSCHHLVLLQASCSRSNQGCCAFRCYSFYL